MSVADSSAGVGGLVIGVKIDGESRGSQVGPINRIEMINDQIGEYPLAATADESSKSTHTYSRAFDRQSLEFRPGNRQLID